MIFVLPYFYLYTKSVDESCMVRKISTKKLIEGDWLYEDVKIRRKTIKKSWGGLTKLQIKEIQKKHKTILIKEGIAFIPVFLISFIIILILFFTGLLEVLWNSFW